jgi:hypothetical protein
MKEEPRKAAGSGETEPGLTDVLPKQQPFVCQYVERGSAARTAPPGAEKGKSIPEIKNDVLTCGRRGGEPDDHEIPPGREHA